MSRADCGVTCRLGIAVAGSIERSTTLETGSADRFANMQAFSAAALDLLLDVLAGKAAPPS